MPLHPDVMLDVQLSAVCSRNQFTNDPAPVIEELRQMAGNRGDILAKLAGTWAGFYDDEHTHTLAAALREIDGAEEWVALGKRRAGYVNHGANFLPPGS